MRPSVELRIVPTCCQFIVLFGAEKLGQDKRAMVVLVNGILSVDSHGLRFLRRPGYRTNILSTTIRVGAENFNT